MTKILPSSKELLEKNENYIWKLIHKYNKNNSPTEDLYQEAVLGFLEGLSKYDPQKSPKLMYFCSFYIKDRIFKYFKSLKYHYKLEEVEDNTNPENIIIQENILNKSINNYNLLKYKEKIIIDMYYMEGIHQYKIAKHLNISAERVRQLRNRALSRLVNLPNS